MTQVHSCLAIAETSEHIENISHYILLAETDSLTLSLLYKPRENEKEHTLFRFRDIGMIVCEGALSDNIHKVQRRKGGKPVQLEWLLDKLHIPQKYHELYKAVLKANKTLIILQGHEQPLRQAALFLDTLLQERSILYLC